MDKLKIYTKRKEAVEYKLGEIASLLFGHCHLSMRNKLAADKEYKKMSMKDGATLYRLIAKISNGSSAVQNPIRQSIESLFDLFCIRGDNYAHLNQYNEAFDHRRQNAEKLGSLFASDILRDLVMAECEVRKDTGSDLYLLLDAWKSAEDERPDPKDDNAWVIREVTIQVGRECLNEKMITMLFLKKSGEKYEPYRQDLYNNYNDGIDKFPSSVEEQHSRLDVWKPAYTKIVRHDGSSYVQEGTADMVNKDKVVPEEQNYWWQKQQRNKKLQRKDLMQQEQKKPVVCSTMWAER